MQPDPDGLKFGDKHSVAVMKDGMTVGDLPKDTSCSSSYTGEQLNAKSPEEKKHPKDVAWRSGGARIWYKGGNGAAAIIWCLKDKQKCLDKT